MRKVLYALQFHGQAAPVGDSPSVMKAATSSPSSAITTTIGAGGVDAAIAPSSGGTANFESQVTITGDGIFQEEGTIRFGAGDGVRFSTVGDGRLGPSTDPKLSSGAVIWKIDAGEGQLAGATGYITSNFTVSDTGDVVDNQFGVIFVP